MTKIFKYRIFGLAFFSIITSLSFAQVKVINNVKFIQGDSVYLINKNIDSILIERKPFALRYFCKTYNEKKEEFNSAQIAVLENSADTNFLKVGKSTNGNPYFEQGTGMAPGNNEMYDTVFITNTGHNYLVYENEKKKRVFLISKGKNMLELEWRITAAHYEEKDVQFSELKLSTLYFVIYIDRNLNEIIDKDELKIVKVIFK